VFPSFGYVRSATLKEAVQECSAKNAYFLAGGTDLLGCVREGIMVPEKVVSLRDLKELRGIRPASDGGLRIGALTTLAELAGNQAVVKDYAALAQGAASAASPQLRNQGTLGGNLCQRPRCWYFRGDFHCLRKGGDQCFAVGGQNQYHCLFGGEGCYIVHPSDTAPALVALNAQAVIAGPRGTRTVALQNFFVPPAKDVRKETVLEAGEVLTEVVLPRPIDGWTSSYRKVRARASWDFALAGMAIAIQVKGGTVADSRIVLSGVAPIPRRASGVEKVIKGRTLDQATIDRAAAAAVVDAQPLAENEYKVALVKGIVEEVLVGIGGA
jgi:xanthine dehydrogenase YagS FAD-binding subunit